MLMRRTQVARGVRRINHAYIAQKSWISGTQLQPSYLKEVATVLVTVDGFGVLSGFCKFGWEAWIGLHDLQKTLKKPLNPTVC
jgi:hypothetical protein